MSAASAVKMPAAAAARSSAGARVAHIAAVAKTFEGSGLSASSPARSFAQAASLPATIPETASLSATVADSALAATRPAFVGETSSVTCSAALATSGLTVAQTTAVAR